MVDRDLNGDNKGTCFKCVVKQRDNLRIRYARLAASVISEALDQAEVMVVEFGPDHPETKDLIKMLHNAGQFVKMAWQISQLKLNDVKVLEEQLIDLLQSNGDTVDGSYLMTVIDRVF